MLVLILYLQRIQKYVYLFLSIMKRALIFLFILPVLLRTILMGQSLLDDKITFYEVAPKNLSFHWKDSQGQLYKSFSRLKKILEADKKDLVFAMNGGMYLKDRTPQGLYIEKGQLLHKKDSRKKGFGNFYLQPNGVFYITKDSIGTVSKSSDLTSYDHIYYATQSGPMLLIDGKVHPAFTKGSKNLNIRNGVGILPTGHVLFAISKVKINFYDFATFFKSKGCHNALYLDGYVSKMFLPQKKWIQLGGSFGVIITQITDK